MRPSISRALLGDVLAFRADEDAELPLVVEPLRVFGPLDLGILADDIEAIADVEDRLREIDVGDRAAQRRRIGLGLARHTRLQPCHAGRRVAHVLLEVVEVADLARLRDR
jgi:hypothetical protein